MKLYKLRIVTDRFAGYEVQILRWWWPFWVQLGLMNTHRTIERAEDFARHHKRVVKYL